MQALIDLFNQHPFLMASISTFFVNYVFSAFVSSFEAPTASSSPYYRYMFKFLNTLAANIYRAKDTRTESSPNFQGAVAKAKEKDNESTT